MNYLTADAITTTSLPHAPLSEGLFQKAVSCLPEKSIQKLFYFYLIEETIQAMTKDMPYPASAIRNERSYCPTF